MVRDQALAIAGLLVDKIGGPSVKPYQPEGLWNEIGGGGAYVQDHGDDLYRRSLYTFWKRTIPPPRWRTSTPRRARATWCETVLTNTPLQALDLMNDVTSSKRRACSRERMMKEGGTTPPERIAFAFRLATARTPERGRERRFSLDAFVAEPRAVQVEAGRGPEVREPRRIIRAMRS